MPKTTNKNAEEILKIIVKSIKYFQRNPIHLAWAMMKYSATLKIHNRTNSKDTILNSKDTILNLKGITKKQKSLIYDAWCMTDSAWQEFHDITNRLEAKKGKTMQDWLAICLDTNYRYKLIFSDPQSVYDHLLCVNGGGTSWVTYNKINYIANTLPAGNDNAIFASYTNAEPNIDKEIKNKINEITANPRIQKYIKKGIENAKKRDAKWIWTKAENNRWFLAPPEKQKSNPIIKEIQTRFLKNTVDTSKTEYYPICQYANISNWPKNAHPSYLVTGIKIANEILSESNNVENKKQIKLFLKKTKYATWTHSKLLKEFGTTSTPI